MTEVYECNVCHVLFARHVPQCPVCRRGAMTLVGTLSPSSEETDQE